MFAGRPDSGVIHSRFEDNAFNLASLPNSLWSVGAGAMASGSLIRALGGGWTVQSLPTEKQTLPFGPLDYHAVKY